MSEVRYIKYDPCNGFQLDPFAQTRTAEQYRVAYPGNVWFHNPYTGMKRPLEEIHADKFGYELSGDSLEQLEREKQAMQKAAFDKQAAQVAQKMRELDDIGSALDKQEGGDHYKKLAIQPIEFIFKNKIGYAEGNVIKYVTRWRDKNGVEDLRKARHYLDLLIEAESGDSDA
ncbi:DUF3310 domain-containing protein [Bordetella hinzii]|uniref:DUF3310 domain-containing protein n=1 Tax=Bordetella hinzii TaxID=103855 RepID=UPI001F0D9013|nr:DUF3310 domain-containing protein [Bordetella hinzii]